MMPAADGPIQTGARMEGGKRIRKTSGSASPGVPLISVITVVFNAASTIEDTIRSVLAQTYGNVEYLVIDGGSTDGTLEIVKKHDADIDYWVSERDTGIYDAMNKGIRLANGDYVGLLNADDMFANSDVLDNIVQVFKSSDVDAVFSCLDIVDSRHPEKILRKYRVSRLSLSLLRLGIMPPHPTFYCKKSCYLRAGLYDTDYRIASDFEMLTRLLVKYHISWKFLNRVTVIMRAGGVSSSGIMARITLNREILRACKENGLYSNALLLLLKIPFRLLEMMHRGRHER